MAQTQRSREHESMADHYHNMSRFDDSPFHDSTVDPRRPAVDDFVDSDFEDDFETVITTKDMEVDIRMLFWSFTFV